MKKLLPLVIGLCLGIFSINSHAESLLDVYQHAKENNPDLRKAAADRDAAFAGINVSRGALLPQLGLGGSYTINRGYRDSNTKNNTAQGTLQLSQSIFDMSLWRQLSIQEQLAGIQEITYQTAEQQLMLDTAVSYFNVLNAIDSLKMTEAQKHSVYKTLDQVTQQFNVGLVAITDMQNARANYDLVLSNEVLARNTLNNSLEDLRQVAGIYYHSLASLNVEHFKTNKTDDVNTLLKQAEDKNLSLITARLSQDVARQQIKLAQTGHYPTLDLSAGTSLTDYERKNNSIPPDSISGNTSVGVNLNIPIYSGGTVSAQVKQAQYNFMGASDQLESTHRSVVNLVHSSNNNIDASVSSIAALEQSVVSAKTSLDATEAGYQVGTRTIVDVLSAITTLYNAKQQLSNARYSYLINLINLKSALGTLNQEDLTLLNDTLGEIISTQPETIIINETLTVPKM